SQRHLFSSVTLDPFIYLLISLDLGGGSSVRWPWILFIFFSLDFGGVSSVQWP
ncbi:hypothetical protein C1645_839984, partial [Glomus cerebriforme]